MSSMPGIWRFAARDLLALGLAVGAIRLELPDSHLGVIAAVAIGALVAFVGFLAHEWGHLIGALVTRSRVYTPRRLTSLFLFHFDTRTNDRRQFLAMSLGGFVASVLAIAIFVLTLPLDALAGKVALGLAGLGVIATFVLEVPTFVRVLRGGALPEGFVYEPIP